VEFNLRGHRSGGALVQTGVPASKPPYEGKFAEVMALVASSPKAAVQRAWAWRHQDPADVLALIALGEALEATAQPKVAARAYGSLIDLFPGRADLRRYAGARLERLGAAGFALAADTYRQAHSQRPDHPSSHRLLAYALLRAGHPDEAFRVAAEATRRTFPADRFPGVERILRDDAGLLAAAWLRRAPQRKDEILARLAETGGRLPTTPSVRFVLNWETDANDVDFHIHDGGGGHAYYSSKVLPSGGELYADITRGYGPECFTIEGRPVAYPYRLQAHYYSRGPMGYGMGKLEVLEHDGKGGLRQEQRPFIVMVDGAYVDLGVVKGPLRAAR
jgi:tetratricopeptide (TPR) repeat protein